MRLLVLGPSGGIGRWLTRLAAEGGHDVTALVRPGSASPAEGLAPAAAARVAVRRGEAADPATLDAAVAGHDAVLSALGLRRAGRSPWAPLLSPPDLTARVARHLAPAMARHGVRRLVVVSAGGVGDSRARVSRPVGWLVGAGNVGVAYRDLAAMEAALAASPLDWTAARPVTLVDGPPTGGARPVDRYTLRSTVRRADVARWMLDAAARPDGGARTVLLGS
jgi:uncharacterized protein YbjT (DUF2867 family)